LNGITSLPNIMKIYQAVQKLLVGHTHTHTHTETGDLISLLSFLEGRLKNCNISSSGMLPHVTNKMFHSFVLRTRMSQTINHSINSCMLLCAADMHFFSVV
jgi:hypothetical protein